MNHKWKCQNSTHNTQLSLRSINRRCPWHAGQVLRPKAVCLVKMIRLFRIRDYCTPNSFFLIPVRLCPENHCSLDRLFSSSLAMGFTHLPFALLPEVFPTTLSAEIFVLKRYQQTSCCLSPRWTKNDSNVGPTSWSHEIQWPAFIFHNRKAFRRQSRIQISMLLRRVLSSWHHRWLIFRRNKKILIFYLKQFCHPVPFLQFAITIKHDQKSRTCRCRFCWQPNLNYGTSR